MAKLSVVFLCDAERLVRQRTIKTGATSARTRIQLEVQRNAVMPQARER
jgi:hypothetical protein